MLRSFRIVGDHCRRALGGASNLVVGCRLTVRAPSAQLAREASGIIVVPVCTVRAEVHGQARSSPSPEGVFLALACRSMRSAVTMPSSACASMAILP